MEECIRAILKIIEEKEIATFAVSSLCSEQFGFPT
jgi:hypothetical protein